jgi:hypothetical protein
LENSGNSGADIFFKNLARKLHYRAWDAWFILGF